MKKIEVGDFVEFVDLSDANPKQIIEIKDGVVFTKNNKCLLEQCALWLPKGDEYIWDSHYRTLGKVTFSDGVTVSYIDVLGDVNDDILTTSLNYCEPFFGTIPNFIVTSESNN